MAKDVEFEIIEKVSEAVRRGVPTLKDEEVQISATGDGKRLRLGVAIETRLEPAVREAVFGALREVGCKNVEIECDDADQLVLFADAADVR